MQAAVCDGHGRELVIKQIPIPTPGTGQLLVKMESCGVCHSDLHIRDGDESLPSTSYPLVLGHEGIGHVVEVGGGSGAAPEIGTRIGLPWIFSTCETCHPCTAAQETLCETQLVRGLHKHGAFAEYALVDERFAIEIPDPIDSIKGAPLLCAGLTAWSALKKVNINAESTVLIVGAGGLGQYAVGIAKSKGATVWVVDPNNERLKQAQALGADMTFTADNHVAATIRNTGGADIAINFAPHKSAWQLIEKSVKPMSEIVCVALVYDPVDLSMMWLIDGGHRVLGSSVGSRDELVEFLEFAADNQQLVDVESVPLAGVNEALDRLKAGDFKGRLCVDFGL